MPELLGDGRGFLMDTEYSMIDPWGNSRRDFPNAESGMNILTEFWEYPATRSAHIITGARSYIESRTWDFPTNQVDSVIAELLDAK